MNNRQNCNADIVNAVQHRLPKELVSQDTDLRMLPHEKGVFSEAECRLSFPRAGQY